jgi:type I restriction enzyme S subunit
MKSPWPTKKLGEICEERKEKNIKNLNLPVYAVSNIFGFVLSEEFFSKRVYSESLRNYKLVYKHDFAYNPARVNVGSLGLFREDDPGLISPMYIVFYIKDKNILNPLFLFYLLKTNFYQNKIKNLAASRGSIRQTLKLEDLLNLEIPLPPFPVQQKIVKILDTIQSAVEIQEKIIEKTKELKKSLMAELFKYGAPSFRRGGKLKKTEIGEIPEDWEVARLGDNIEKPQYGISISATDENTGTRLLRITDIQDEKVDWTLVPFCRCTKDEVEKYQLKEGDILVARIGATTGKSYFIKNVPQSVFGSYLIRIRAKASLDPNYLSYYFQTNIYWFQINLAKSGRLKGGINIPLLENLKLPLPPLPEQQEIAEILQTIDQKIEIEKKKKELYEELFKTMLNKIMSQEIDINLLDY